MILGLSGERPETVDPDRAEALVADVEADKSIVLGGRRAIRFDPRSDIRFDFVTAPKRHPNTLAFCARDAAGQILSEEIWLSVGGGFIVREDEEPAAESAGAAFPIRSATPPNCSSRAARAASKSANWCAPTKRRRARGPRSTPISIRLIGAMFASVDRGLAREGPLPGRLKVMRRAKAIFDRLRRQRRTQRARRA